MSQDEKTVGTTVKYAITKEVMRILNIGESGKIDSFYHRLNRKFKDDIEIQEQNKKSLEFDYQRKKRELERNLEDANEALSNAWLDVDPKNVATNAMQDSYISVFLENVSHAQKTVEVITETIEKNKEDYEETLKLINTKIADAKSGMKMIEENKD